jgi:NitT/TauT family transport system ATP-binding protein
MNEKTPILVARDLSMTYPNGNGGLAALRGVRLEVRWQEFVCVVGPSGCGKTTLLRLLAGLLSPTEGEVLFEGNQLRSPQPGIGFVFQEANLMPWRTALRNVSLPLELRGDPPEEMVGRAQSMIELVGLAGFEGSLPRDLSGGMAQRVAIARALVHEPSLLLLDEPFGSLDALTRERMASELLRIWSAHKVTVVMVTHSISEALLLADRLLVLSQRPGTVRLDIPVPLPRPRTLEMTYTRTFGELAARARAAIESLPIGSN